MLCFKLYEVLHWLMFGLQGYSKWVIYFGVHTPSVDWSTYILFINWDQLHQWTDQREIQMCTSEWNKSSMSVENHLFDMAVNQS